ncbi:DMT family transporter [Roseomonas sp. NAR14]|uniref:DMT family transporter n=1 Tax=Roseomonas acroporae TaxID=2937791 RepID=A0A9X1YA62_9PROT|nr:DMT family transporter [Roseomonas acroporae]MCK8784937.1 DMT family transporter [Roseomonas acroporae]
MILSPLWLPATLLAALCQTWRTAMQQKLRGRLSVNAAGLVRFLYGAPTALVLLLGYWLVAGGTLPALTWRFLGFALLAGLCQILATNLLIMAFGYRNFAVGTAYSKTEAAQSALIALVALGENLHPLSWVGIGVGLCGVLVLSLAGRELTPRGLLAATVQPAALCGLGAGFLFGLTAVFIKLANQSLIGPDPILHAVYALFITNSMQTVIQGAYVAWREPAQLRAALTSWRSSSLVGVLSALGSAGWWTGFALAPVALVRSVGQVEMVFTLLFSRFYLNERPSRIEVAGALTIVAGVLLVVAGR